MIFINDQECATRRYDIELRYDIKNAVKYLKS